MSSIYTHRRARWTSQALGGRVHPLDHTVRGVYLHHPAHAGRLIGATDDRLADLLRGWRDYHESLGWNDIGYSVMVDAHGHIWELRGIDMESGANGGTASNNEAPAILLALGNGEGPTQAMIDGVNRVLAEVRRLYPTARYIRGHRQSPDAATSCPGPGIMAAIKAGRFHYGGRPAPVVKPDAPVVKPAGAPAFPLPRRRGLLCYYGPAGGPITSVSGKGLNTLVPADVQKVGGRWRSHGLARWQQRMMDRGWTELARAGGADGRYGPVTAKVARQFQRAKGLKPDGLIGPATWAAAWAEPVR